MATIGLVSRDRVIEIMRQAGRHTSTEYTETSRVGLAVIIVECARSKGHSGRYRAASRLTRHSPDADHFSGVPSARKCSRARDS